MKANTFDEHLRHFVKAVDHVTESTFRDVLRLTATYAHQEYVEAQRIGRAYDSYQAQIICAYVLQRASGISAKKAMTYLERLLATPTLQPDFAVACGDAFGEAKIFTPVRPLAYRSLAFSVVTSARGHAG